MNEAPELATVVIGLGAPPELADAVRSVQEQGVAVEAVVVNSGGGGVAAMLGRRGVEVPVVERPQVCYAGGARNLGIAATRARWVSFLASDCLALPGWAAGRLAAHRAGAQAVGSALLNSHPRSVVAWVAHLALHVRRLPDTPREAALAYGASYDRALFQLHGLFREDLECGEDTEFHQRLPAGARPVWAPEVRTVHRTSTNLVSVLADQFRRGRRAAVAWQRIPGGPSPQTVARWTLSGLPEGLRLAWQATPRAYRTQVRAALPLLPVASLAYALGAITVGDPSEP